MTAASKSASDGGPATDTVGFTYDPFGNRLTRTAWNASSGTTTERYAYDGWDTAKPDPVGGEAFDADLDLDGANAVIARRLFGPGFDDPLARQDAAGNVAWYGADRLGSVRLVFDNSGAVTGTRDYAGFGAIAAESGSGLDRYAFTGREWDPALGEYDYRRRPYDPGSGRFTAEDPLAADPANPYRYAGNSPTNATDPSGLWTNEGVIAALIRAGRSDVAGWLASGNVAISPAVQANHMIVDALDSGRRAYARGGRVFFDIPAGYSDDKAAAYIIKEAESSFWNSDVHNAFKGWLWDQVQNAITSGGDIGAARGAYYDQVRKSAADLGLAAYDIIKNVYLEPVS